MAHFEWFNATRQPHKFNLVENKEMKQGQTFEVVGVVKNANNLHFVLSFAGENTERKITCVPFSKFLKCRRLGRLVSDIDSRCSVDTIEKIIKSVRGEKPFTLSIAQLGDEEAFIGF